MIEDQFSKFNYKEKRALIDGLGTIIKYISGNPDNNDLIEINKNLESLFKTQGIVAKQINKYTSFANHITERYSKDFNSIQDNLNSTLQALSNLSRITDMQLVIQYNSYMRLKLLNILRSIERTISLASAEVINLEIISNSEIIEIINHLKTIYKRSELPELNHNHMFTILEFSKFRIVSVKEIITCILYFPILEQSLHQYTRIYPIPSSNNKVIIPPSKYHLQNAKGELWTDEQCRSIVNQTICVSAPRINKCSLFSDLNNCVHAVVSNDYKLYTQLNNGQLLVSSKLYLTVTEECQDKIHSTNVKDNVLIGSVINCKIIIDDQIFEDTFVNFTFKNSLKIYDYKANVTINLQQKHLGDFSDLKEEVESLQEPIIVHPMFHFVHFSVTIFIVIIFCISFVILYVLRHKIQVAFKNKSRSSELSMKEFPFHHGSQNEDVLS